ncbi:MAG: hypothetical protein L6Q47_09540 [Ignavibacteriaceae bacterium]|nr:hypothetical protein [Ignavibacteriaceae bacterium]
MAKSAVVEEKKKLKSKAAVKSKKPQDDPEVRKSTLIEDRKRLGKTNLEYLIRFYFSFDKLTGKQYYIVEFSTFRLFSQLNYSITTKVKKQKDQITISLLGLSTNNSYYTNSYSAVSFLRFEDLFGDFTVNIVKQDGTVNSAQVAFNIYNKTIEIRSTSSGNQGTDRIFCQFETDNSQFTFG